MPQNRLSSYSNQPASSMSLSHTYTVGVGANPLSADDEDLDDICPVCDGECTCANRPKPRPTIPENTASGNAIAQPAPTTPNNPTPLVPSVPTLKIKLTAGMLSKARAAQALSNYKKSRNPAETTYEIANDGGQPSTSPTGQPILPPGSASSAASGSGIQAPKRRGRPPKTAYNLTQSASAGHLFNSDNEADTFPSGSLSYPSRLQKRQDTNTRTKAKSKAKVAKPKGKGTTVKKGKAAAVATKKKITTLSGDDLGSDLTDLDDQGIEDDDDDGRSMQFPTFVSASALSTSTSSEDSDTDSLSNFDSDSSMEAEEENYILSEERRHEKVRVRKELLGEDGYKRKDPHNNWVIRPRKQSVGGSDVDMDVDSDATEDEDDEEEESEDGGDEDELDDSNPGVTYAGVGTGWSDEDDESSFDADLFFANLSDSTADGQSTCTGDDEERDHPDWDGETTGPAIHAARLQMDNLPFEVSQGWDGQIVFTNGLGEGQGILDLDFEVSAAQLVEDSASPSQDSDVEMQTTEYDEEYEEAGEYGEEEESDGGDTTDDDYVDKDGLPTKRMLELFRWPSSLSAIDPMSTVSPTVSPHPRSRRRTQESVDSRSPRDSPRPADILAGKTFWDEHEELDRGDVAAGVASSSRGGPLMGTFEAGQDHPRRAILTGSNDEIPSPFPRLKHRKKASSLSSGLDQSRSRAPSRPHSLSVSTTSSTLQGLSSEEGQPPQILLDHPPAEAIDLHDVLDVSFLDTDAADPLVLSSTSASEGEASRSHLHSMNRWSHVPMGTFRRTRESGAILSDGASTSWQAQTPRVSAADGFAQGSSRMLKSSPFSEITWHSRGSNPPKGTRRPSKTFKNIIISPVILPVRDGDRTPTNVPPHTPQREQTHHKSRKELRRETKMKRKSYGPVHHQHQHHQRQHFQHNHHPNSKSRSSSSMQRTNFFNSPTGAVPPLNL